MKDKTINLKLRIPEKKIVFDISPDENESFEEIINLAKDELKVSEDRIRFLIGEKNEELDYLKRDRSYCSMGEIYLKGKGIGWKEGSPGEIVIMSLYFGA